MAAEELKGRSSAMAADGYDEPGMQIDVMELVYRLLEKAWLIILVGLLAATAAGLYTHFLDESYTATAKLYVIGDSTAIDLSQLNFGDKLAEDYVQVFKNRDVHDSVSDALVQLQKMDADDVPAEFAAVKAYLDTLDKPYALPNFESVQRRLSVTQMSDTRILSISYVCGSKEEAKMVVDVYAHAATKFISAKMGAEKPPTIFEKPYASDDPTAPNMTRNVALALLIGAFAMVAILICQFILDDRIRTAEQLEKHLGLPTLGMMPVQVNEKMSQKRRKEGHA